MASYHSKTHESNEPFQASRKRRAEEEDLRYSDTDGIASINGITTGIKRWSQRYLAECGGQANHDHIVKHAEKWKENVF